MVRARAMHLFRTGKSYYLNAERRLIESIDRSSNKLPAWQAGIWCWLLSSFLSGPRFNTWDWATIHGLRSGDYLRLCQNPLARDLTEPILAYRLTLPTIVWVLNLPALAALALPMIINVAFLGFSFHLVRRRAGGVTATLATVMISLSWGFLPSNWMPGEFTDTVSHLCSVLLLLSTNPAGVVLWVLLGLFNDERTILALPFIFLWHFPPAFTPGWLRGSARWLTAATTAVGIYLLLRHALAAGWIGPGINTPAIYQEFGATITHLQPRIGSWETWALDVVWSFRWSWLIIAAYVGLLAARFRWLSLFTFTGALIAGTLLSGLVLDIGRSIGFMLPAWFLAVAGLQAEDESRARVFLWRVVLALIVTPVIYYVDSAHPLWESPLPFVIWPGLRHFL